jgi:hypothetical protein
MMFNFSHLVPLSLPLERRYILFWLNINLELLRDLTKVISTLICHVTAENGTRVPRCGRQAL